MKDGFKRFLMIAFILAVIALAAALVYGRYSGKENAPAGKTENIVSRDNLEGVYSVRLSNADSVICTTCELSRFTDNDYQIYMVTDRGPRYFSFNVNLLGGLYSEELGEGSVSYNDDLKTTSITFRKEDKICELSK